MPISLIFIRLAAFFDEFFKPQCEINTLSRGKFAFMRKIQVAAAVSQSYEIDEILWNKRAGKLPHLSGNMYFTLPIMSCYPEIPRSEKHDIGQKKCSTIP